MSRQINLLISNSNGLNIGGTPHFIQILGVTVRLKRSTVTMKQSTMDHFENIVAVGSWMEHLDAIVEMSYKTRLIAPLGSRLGGRDALLAVSSLPL